MKKQSFSYKLLSRFISETLLEELIGDLQELHTSRVSSKGRLIATILYFLDLFSLIWSLKNTKTKYTKSNSMLGNYIKVSWRNSLKNKSQTISNLIGLTLGISVFIIIYTHVAYQYSFDKFHNKSHRIYRVASDLATPDRDFHFAITPPWIGPALASSFSGIESFVRFSKRSGDIKYNDIQYRETGIYYVDPQIFDVFSFQLISSETKTPLEIPYTVLISEEIAYKYFGDEDPIGRKIYFNTDTSGYFVQGIFKDIPSNSHLQFDFLFSNETLVAQGNNFDTQWFNFSFYTYVLIQENADPKNVSSGFAKFTDELAGEAEKSAGQEIDIYLQPLTRIHLESNLENEPQETINAKTLNIFAGIGVLTLLMACINFINLSTITSLSRAKEVGIRKVAGALKSGIVHQYIADAFLMIFTSTLLSAVLLYFFSPYVSAISGTSLHPEILFDFYHIIILTSVFLSIILFSGIYPGILVANFKLTNILKGRFQRSQSGIIFRKTLVVVQLIIAITLIIGAVVVQDQWSILSKTDPGFQRKGIFTINFYSNPEIRSRYQVIKQELLRHPHVNSVSASFNIPSQDPFNWYLQFENTQGEMENTSMFSYVVDQDFIDAYGLSLVAGKGFSGVKTRDSASFIVNVSATRFFGYQDPKEAVGRKIRQFGKLGEIIGVVDDFHARSLKFKMEPLVIQSNPNFYRFFTINATSNNFSKLTEEINSIWLQKVSSRKPEISVLESDLRMLYEKEEAISSLISSFTFLALFISVLGLWGLSGFSVAQDKKTISIKKVLGANTASILLHYNKSYIWLITFSWIVASLISYFGLQWWLSTYPSRVSLGISYFIMSGAIAMLVVIATISYAVLRGASLKPVKNLRLES